MTSKESDILVNRALADAICEAAMESLVEFEPYNPVVELCLCEHNKIIPKPNQLYRYIVEENCENCNELATAYGEEE